VLPPAAVQPTTAARLTVPQRTTAAGRPAVRPPAVGPQSTRPQSTRPVVRPPAVGPQSTRPQSARPALAYQPAHGWSRRGLPSRVPDRSASARRTVAGSPARNQTVPEQGAPEQPAGSAGPARPPSSRLRWGPVPGPPRWQPWQRWRRQPRAAPVPACRMNFFAQLPLTTSRAVVPEPRTATAYPHGCALPVFAGSHSVRFRVSTCSRPGETGQVVRQKFRVSDGTEGVGVTHATRGVWLLGWSAGEHRTI
jgi:hypothetical protein